MTKIQCWSFDVLLYDILVLGSVHLTSHNPLPLQLVVKVAMLCENVDTLFNL